MRKLGICIPTFNRYQFTIDCFAQVLDDDRIETVTIVDDASTDDSYEKLKWYFRDNDKVRIHQNKENKDCYFNKHEAVEKSNSEWICLWDSDNVFGKDYLDALYSFATWDRHTIYLPEFAKPHFSAKQWSGLTITTKNVSQYAGDHLMTNLNACNMFVNRDEYLKIFDGSCDPHSSDSIFFSYTWLIAGNKILVTPNLEYQHTIHNDNSGHFTQNQHKTVKFHKELMDKIKQLK